MELLLKIMAFFEQKQQVLESRIPWLQNYLQEQWPPAGITVTIGLLLLTVLFLVYSGMMHGVRVQMDLSTRPKRTIGYLFGVGGYREASRALDQWRLLYPHLPRITILYNSPVYPAMQLEWNKAFRSYAIGFILNEDSNKVGDKEHSKLQELGFQFAVLPEDSFAVTSQFVHRNYLSLFFAFKKIFGPLRAFVDDKHLCAHPIIQVDKDSVLNFTAPLSKQYDFYVKEASIFYGISLVFHTSHIQVVKDQNGKISSN